MSVVKPSDAAPTTTRFRVGAWNVDPALNELQADGRVVHIEPKAMAVLVALAASPGQVVTREALLCAAWPGVVVGDDALTQVVVKLRRALGDAAEHPQYIQTIAKRGYRLVAPHERVAGATIPAGEAEATPGPGSSAVPAGGDPPSGPEVPRARTTSPAGRPAGVPHRVVVLAGTLAASVLLVVLVSTLNGGPAGRTTLPPRPTIDSESARPSVSIRPLTALGDDSQEALLARAITADLVTDLSRVGSLWVLSPPVAGATARAVGAIPQSDRRGRHANPGHYAVSGTVQRLGERLRVQVRLEDEADGRVLWSERFDRPLPDMFGLQDDLVTQLLRELPVRLGDAETRRVARRYTRNLDAYRAFQRGQLALQARSRAGNEAARTEFGRALELDGGFARAHAALALTHVADYRNRWVDDPSAALGRALALATTAQQMDSEQPEALWTLAFVYSHHHEHARAIEYLDRALLLDSSFADAYALKGGIYTSLGRPRDSIAQLRTAMRLAPDSGYLYLMLLGRAYLFLGDLEQARSSLEQAQARNPGFIDTHVYLAVLHVATGERGEAEWQAEEIRALEPHFTARRWLQTNPTGEALRGRLVDALATLGF